MEKQPEKNESEKIPEDLVAVLKKVSVDDFGPPTSQEEEPGGSDDPT